MKNNLNKNKSSSLVFTSNNKKHPPLALQVTNAMTVCLFTLAMLTMLLPLSAELKEHKLVLIGTGIIYSFISIFSIFFNESKQKKVKLVYLGIPFVLFLLIFYKFNGYFFKIYNQMLASIGRFKGEYFFGISIDNQATSIFLLIVIIMMLVSIFSILLSFKYTIIFIWLFYIANSILFIESINIYSVLLLILATISLVNFSIYDGIVFQNKTTLILGVGLSFFTTVICLGVYLTNLDSKTTNFKSVSTLQQSVFNKKEQFKYGNKDQSQLPKGDLVDYDGKRNNSKILSVTMDKPEAIYLKNFVGNQFENEVWKDYTPKQLYGNYPMNYWLNQENFSSFSQLNDIAEITDEYPKEYTTLKVDNLAANTKNWLVPYGIKSNEKIKAAITNDASILSDGFSGQSHFEYKVLKNSLIEYPMLVSGFSNLGKSQSTNEYKKNESNYNKYVYKEFTGLPKELESTLQMITQGGRDSANHAYYEEAQIKIDEYIKMRETSKNKPDKNGPKTTPEAFIDKYLSGKYKLQFDTEYATLSTLMYRSMGIPARYVEGFIVKPTDLGVPNKPISIPSTNAHAWTEIYQDGIGWVPKEHMPAYQDIMPQPEFTGLTYKGDNDTDQETDGQDSVNKPDAESVLDKEEDSFSFDKDQRKDFKDIIKIILISIFSLIILVILTLLLTRLVKTLKSKKIIKNNMNSSNNLVAAQATFQEVLKLLKIDHVTYTGGSLFDIERILSEKYTDQYKKIFDSVITDLQKAYFSESELSDKSRQKSTRLFEITKNIVFQDQNFKNQLTRKIEYFFNN